MISICIPTYNRYAFLRWTVNRLKRDFPDSQIIVSDNDSRDSTRSIQLEVDYICQEKNIGAFPNMRAALLEAKGEYAVYCGDDDYLVPEAIKVGVDYLNQNPKCVAYYAPCILWDEVNNKPDWPAYRAKEATFDKASATDLFNFVIQYHVWPEHAIYRTSALQTIMQPRTKAYWAFLDLAHAVGAGEVHFGTQSFLRNITAHPIGDREKLGNQQCLTDFDQYRAGLEVMVHKLCEQIGVTELPDVALSNIHKMIAHFMYLRIEVAHRMTTLLGNTEDADIFRRRMAICRPLTADMTRERP